MLIRSQNKKCIINLNNVDTLEYRENKIVYYNGGEETKGTLGTYSTEEKAIKVLDMIQKSYERRWEIFEMPRDSEV